MKKLLFLCFLCFSFFKDYSMWIKNTLSETLVVNIINNERTILSVPVIANNFVAWDLRYLMRSNVSKIEVWLQKDYILRKAPKVYFIQLLSDISEQYHLIFFNPEELHLRVETLMQGDIYNSSVQDIPIPTPYSSEIESNSPMLRLGSSISNREIIEQSQNEQASVEEREQLPEKVPQEKKTTKEKTGRIQKPKNLIISILSGLGISKK